MSQSSRPEARRAAAAASVGHRRTITALDRPAPTEVELLRAMGVISDPPECTAKRAQIINEI